MAFPKVAAIERPQPPASSPDETDWGRFEMGESTPLEASLAFFSGAVGPADQWLRESGIDVHD
jgi:hypothetical protein